MPTILEHGASYSIDQNAYPGFNFVPPGFHAGGLRYHGMAPMISHLRELDVLEATAYHQNACFESGVMFGRTEGILPAPEANHAVKGAIEEALRCKREGKSETILFNLCGHGHFDMQAYTDYFAGNLEDGTTTNRNWRWLSPACLPWQHDV